MNTVLRVLVCVVVIGFISSPALSTPFVTPAQPVNIGVGEVKQIGLTLEPSGFPLGAFNLIFGVAGNIGLEIVEFAGDPSFFGSADLAGGRFSIAGDFLQAPRSTPVVLGSVTVRGLAAGGQLLLTDHSNVTDFETFQNTAIGGAIVTVIPEPGTMALVTTGLIAIGLRRRR